MDRYLDASLKLHQYLVFKHWNGRALIGPDPGIRFNYRIGRFIKSYIQNLPWNDDLYYLQGQGYWVLANWILFKRKGDEMYRDIALLCSEHMLTRQRDDGAWDYPNPEWKGRIANAEGTWGAIGLLESSRQVGGSRFINGVLRWYNFLTEKIGFQRVRSELAVNYFANQLGSLVPNNSAFVLRFLAELADVTGDNFYLQRCADLLSFVQRVQKITGEFPYAVQGPGGGKSQQHFQCYQYNAFQCLDLIRYYELTGDTTALPIVTKVLNFLRDGLSRNGYAFYECGNRHRTVTYHTAVLGAAFNKAKELGIDGYDALAELAYNHLLGLQRLDGGFPYSQNDYYLLSDQRCYPRYLAMILYFILLKNDVIGNQNSGGEDAQASVR